MTDAIQTTINDEEIASIIQNSPQINTSIVETGSTSILKNGDTLTSTMSAPTTLLSSWVFGGSVGSKGDKGDKGEQGDTGPVGPSGDGFTESNPVFTYTDGLISRIDYLSGNYKVFTYVDSVLTQLDYVMGSTTKRKTFNWTNDGILANIVEIIL
jgi:hypothetical protein